MDSACLLKLIAIDKCYVEWCSRVPRPHSTVILYCVGKNHAES